MPQHVSRGQRTTYKIVFSFCLVLNSGSQGWSQGSLSSEPSCQPRKYYILMNRYLTSTASKYCFTLYKVVLHMTLFNLQKNPAWQLVIFLVYIGKPRAGILSYSLTCTVISIKKWNGKPEFVTVIFPSQHLVFRSPLIVMLPRFCESETRVSGVRVKPEPTMASLVVCSLNPLPCQAWSGCEHVASGLARYEIFENADGHSHLLGSTFLILFQILVARGRERLQRDHGASDNLSLSPSKESV